MEIAEPEVMEESPPAISRGPSLNLPELDQKPRRPANITHLSSPAFESPLRHHRRKPSTPRRVKETLHAHSEYTNSEDDGASIHRINQYIIKQEIGRGSFGAVHLAVDQHEQEYAVKEFSKSRLRKRAQSNILRRPHAIPRPSHLAARLEFNAPLHRHSVSDLQGMSVQEGNSLYLIREEIAIMKKLNHNNLVSLIEVLDDPNEDSLYMVQELCKKGVVMKVGMGEQADPYDPEHCRCWFRDLILGIEYLHAQGIVHRDIKPDNLLLTEDDVLKVADFGVSEMFEKESDMITAKSAGSPAFLSPELCVSRHGDISGKAVDIWAMGVTLYCLYFGKVPFEKTGIFELYDSIKDDHLALPDNCEPDFRDLITKILEKNPTQRIHMEQIREHPWVTKRGHDPLLSVEENTAQLVDPPTEEEMNRAITGNLSSLLVVVKAVKNFKRLLQRRGPYLKPNILGFGDRQVQSPLTMEPESPPTSHHVPRLIRKAQSDSTDDRKSLERALVREGIHHIVDPHLESKTATKIATDEAAVLLEGFKKRKNVDFECVSLCHPTPKRELRASSIQLHGDNATRVEPAEVGRGQAHNPLEDFLFLAVGPNGNDEAPDPPAVSESPPAAEIDIYEVAYHDEVERIRAAQGRSAMLYLTRRVDGHPAHQQYEHMLGLNIAPDGTNTSGFASMPHRAREKSDSKRTSEHTATDVTPFRSQIIGDMARKHVGTVKSSVDHLADMIREKGSQH